MSATPSPDDREELEELTAAWEEYDLTHDVSVIADHLAEDMKFMPPGDSPVVGKEAAVEWLDRPKRGDETDVEQRAENINVSGDLAVVETSVTGTKVPDDGDEPVAVSLKALDVYRRDKHGSWKQIYSIWNDQA